MVVNMYGAVAELGACLAASACWVEIVVQVVDVGQAA
jgi:hypothetical protein